MQCRRSFVATLLSVLIEVAVALLGLVVLGLGPWTWLRPLIVIGLAAFVTVLWALSRLRYLPYGTALSRRLTERRVVHEAVSEMRQIRSDIVSLVRWRVLALAAPLGALYLLLGGSTLYLIARSMGLDGLPWSDILAVYFFSLAAGLNLPVPVDIGVTEAGAVGAFLALGVGMPTAVSAVLLLRALSLAVALLVAVGTMGVLRAETRRLLRERPRPVPEPVAPVLPASDKRSDSACCVPHSGYDSTRCMARTAATRSTRPPARSMRTRSSAMSRASRSSATTCAAWATTPSTSRWA